MVDEPQAPLRRPCLACQLLDFTAYFLLGLFVGKLLVVGLRSQLDPFTD